MTYCQHTKRPWLNNYFILNHLPCHFHLFAISDIFRKMTAIFRKNFSYDDMPKIGKPACVVKTQRVDFSSQPRPSWGLDVRTNLNYQYAVASVRYQWDRANCLTVLSGWLFVPNETHSLLLLTDLIVSVVATQL